MTRSAEFDTADFYDYELPASCIAQEPLPDRAAARLLVLDRASQTIRHRHVRDLPEILAPNDLMVVNDSRVVPARLYGRRAETEGRWEGLFLSEVVGADGRRLLRLLSKTRGTLRAGERIVVVGEQDKIWRCSNLLPAIQEEPGLLIHVLTRLPFNFCLV